MNLCEHCERRPICTVASEADLCEMVLPTPASQQEVELYLVQTAFNGAGTRAGKAFAHALKVISERESRMSNEGRVLRLLRLAPNGLYRPQITEGTLLDYTLVGTTLQRLKAKRLVRHDGLKWYAR